MKPKTMRSILNKLETTEARIAELEHKSIVLLIAVILSLFINVAVIYRLLS